MKYLSKLKKKDLNGKICLLRIDLNIENENLNSKNLRIQGVLPTINFLVKNGAKVVILSHRGRPNTQINSDQRSDKLRANQSRNQGKSEFSLKPFVKIFEKLLKQRIEFINFEGRGKTQKGKARKDAEVNFKDISESINNDLKIKIFLLENLRFFPGEDRNDSKFAKQLANLGDIYINDAFAFSHRLTASMVGITEYLPSYCGLLLEKEIENLDKASKKHKHPFIVILGGAKISDKIGLVNSFKNKVDYILIGGGIAINFFKAQGLPIGDSISDKNADLSELKGILEKNKNILLPADVIIDDRKILDIGANALKIYSNIIKNSKTIIWNGPMGQIENKNFKKGSEGIAKAILQSKAFTAVGGGETITLFQGAQINLDQRSDKLRANQSRNQGKSELWISTGGGAMMDYLAGKKLPGIEALK